MHACVVRNAVTASATLRMLAMSSSLACWHCVHDMQQVAWVQSACSAGALREGGGGGRHVMPILANMINHDGQGCAYWTHNALTPS